VTERWGASSSFVVSDAPPTSPSVPAAIGIGHHGAFFMGRMGLERIGWFGKKSCRRIRPPSTVLSRVSYWVEFEKGL